MEEVQWRKPWHVSTKHKTRLGGFCVLWTGKVDRIIYNYHMKPKTSHGKLGFTLIELLFWLALIGFIIVGYILKNYKEWQHQTNQESPEQLAKSKNLLDRTQGDQKLKNDLINSTP